MCLAFKCFPFILLQINLSYKHLLAKLPPPTSPTPMLHLNHMYYNLVVSCHKDIKVSIVNMEMYFM